MIVYGTVVQVFEPYEFISKNNGKTYVINKAMMKYLVGTLENTILLSRIAEKGENDADCHLVQGAYGKANVDIYVDEKQFISFKIRSFIPATQGEQQMYEGRQLNAINGVVKDVINDGTFKARDGQTYQAYKVILSCCNDDATPFDMPVSTGKFKFAQAAMANKGKQMDLQVLYSVRQVQRNGKTYYMNKCRYVSHRHLGNV